MPLTGNNWMTGAAATYRNTWRLRQRGHHGRADTKRNAFVHQQLPDGAGHFGSGLLAVRLLALAQTLPDHERAHVGPLFLHVALQSVAGRRV